MNCGAITRSTTAVGNGPMPESGLYWAGQADCKDRSGHLRPFHFAISAMVNGPCEQSQDSSDFLVRIIPLPEERLVFKARPRKRVGRIELK